jgi:hypothetical protein
VQDMLDNRGISLRMDAFEAYKVYVALKNHFTSPTYDFFKYEGRTKAGHRSFDKRPDKYFFHKLAKRKDVVDYLVANFVYNDNVNTWIGNLLNNNESDKCYSQLVKTRESLSYIFTNDLSRLEVEFDSNFNVVDGQHPHLLKLYLRHEISIETMIILDDLIGYMKKWNRRIEDDILWPTVYLKCKKFRPFFQYDRDKMKQIVLDKFS